MLKHVKIRTRETKSEEDGKSDMENNRAGLKDETNVFYEKPTYVEFEKIDEELDDHNLVKRCNSNDLSQVEIEKGKTPLCANLIQYVGGEQSLILDENAQETPSTISVTDEVEKSNYQKQNNMIYGTGPQKIEMLRTNSTDRSEYHKSNSIYETMLFSKPGLIRQVRKRSFTNRNSFGYQTQSLDRCSSFLHVLGTKSRIEEPLGKELSEVQKARTYERSALLVESLTGINLENQTNGNHIDTENGVIGLLNTEKILKIRNATGNHIDTENGVIGLLNTEKTPTIRNATGNNLDTENGVIGLLNTEKTSTIRNATGNNLDPEKGVIGLLNSEKRKNLKFLSFFKNLKLFLTTFMAVISTLSVIVFYFYLGLNIILGTPFPKHLYILNLSALCLILFTLILLFSSRNTKNSRIIIYNIILIIFTILSFLISAIKQNYC
ncbi:hypothetical protein CWI36_0165p0040 [Hamiltosporidium magnivora]|uniref:Uncharacterized protein n=2 Tax=Hamiltosporidium TaxID=1176354 RepID=A0A4Q9LJ62_9MICR|nr:hypothetical protein CWI36_0165p0040 [Hamiltosporidium magnivora]